MAKALYRRYRSKSFDDVVGQDHITDTLKKAVSSGRLSHAYLFTGPRGVGKTSVARILAHEANGLPYKDESGHLDIIEIDAASNNGVEDVRDLREKVHVSPTSAKYKVYIIDEVHMLSKPAFNALLKTLEEPPAHAIFILATTEAHKLPETIISRTQRFEFKPITSSLVAKHLAKIAKAEKIKIDEAALGLLAQHGEGSFRDSISLLDQLSAGGETIDAKAVERVLGIPSAAAVEAILEAVKQGDIATVLDSLDKMRARGIDAASAAKALASRLRQLLAEGQAGSWLAPLLKTLLDVPASQQPDIYLEVTLLEAALANRPIGQTEEVAATAAFDSIPPAAKPEKKEANNPTPRQTRAKRNLDENSWNEILETTKQQAASLYTALRLAEPGLSGHVLSLSFKFPLHQKKLAQAKNKDLVAKIASSVLGKELTVEASLKEPDTAKEDDEDAIQTISNIFPAAEMLES